MKIIFAGTPEFASTALNSLLKSEHEVIAVYTQPDRPAGRGRKLTASPVKQLATQHDIPVYQPQSLKHEEEQKLLRSLNADLMVVAAYGLLLPLAVLQIPSRGCINIHASLLPRWRGAAPIHRAILAGDSETGITIMQMDEGLDTGGMLLKKSCPILPGDTSACLHDRLAALGGEALLEALKGLETGSLVAKPQDNALATYASKLSKDESKIDWNKSAEEIDRQIRGLNPWPVAQCNYDEKVLRIWFSKCIGGDTSMSPGSVIQADKQGVDVATGKGIIRLLTLQLPGGKPLDAASFINSNSIMHSVLN